MELKVPHNVFSAWMLTPLPGKNYPQPATLGGRTDGRGAILAIRTLAGGREYPPAQSPTNRDAQTIRLDETVPEPRARIPSPFTTAKSIPPGWAAAASSIDCRNSACSSSLREGCARGSVITIVLLSSIRSNARARSHIGRSTLLARYSMSGPDDRVSLRWTTRTNHRLRHRQLARRHALIGPGS
jgi:hypothetical protein